MDDTQSEVSFQLQRQMPESVRDDRKNRYNCLCIEDRHHLYSSLPNRHERLFAFGKSGVFFARTCLQVTYLFSIVYQASQLVFNFRNTTHLNPVYISLHIVPQIALAIVLYAFLPNLLTTLTIVTNIEMMKDAEIIEDVISEQKLLRAKRSHRIFQVMKVIRRELAQELRKQIDDKRLRGVTRKHIVESFQQLGG